MLLVALALLAQTLPGLQTYTTPDPVGIGQIGLAMPNGRFVVDLGPGCDGITPGENVELDAGSGDVGSLVLEDGTLCNIYFVAALSDVPCATNDVGDCDVAFDTQPED